ncbi:MAG: stage V sporulation protein T [Gracilibacteraceae bacterium]|jgi:AbrB family transcriptional regulator (stage V sporulation protein T)|nr:stage V sporulation protein T [Gracilibacteraceae bacterium]
MKATGIVRRIDDLGRVVIPKEIRRTLRIREGDPLEICVGSEGEVILEKYSPIGELGDYAKEYADSLFETTGHIACIADRDVIIAVSGASKKDFLNKTLSAEAERAMDERKTIFTSDGSVLSEGDEKGRMVSQVIAPIITEGDPIGVVILMSKDPNTKMGELEAKLVETAAGFLAKQMEQ